MGPPAHNGPESIGDAYLMLGDQSANVTLHHDKLAASPTESILTIEVWDQY